MILRVYFPTVLDEEEEDWESDECVSNKPLNTNFSVKLIK